MFTDFIQHVTTEERVAMLEIQVTDIEGQVTNLDEDVDFLFDEQVIQDVRLLNLEVASDEIEDGVESKFCTLIVLDQLFIQFNLTES